MFDIHQNFIVKASSEIVFDAICSPKGLDSWWTLQSDGTPKIGNVYRFYFGPDYDWRAEVVQHEQGKQLTWNMIEAMDDWMNTKVGFEMSEIEGHTQVHFFHLGWAEANEHFGITTFCWGQLLNGLKNYVEQGIVIPHSQRN